MFISILGSSSAGYSASAYGSQAYGGGYDNTASYGGASYGGACCSYLSFMNACILSKCIVYIWQEVVEAVMVETEATGVGAAAEDTEGKKLFNDFPLIVDVLLDIIINYIAG